MKYEASLNSDDFDTLEYVAKAYINTHEKGNKLGERFGLTYTSYGDKSSLKSPQKN